MGVQDFLKSALAASLDTFDAETVTIGGTDISAIIDEKQHANPLGAGAKKAERTLTVQFAASAYTDPLTSGQSVDARGETWQISAEDGAIRKGQIATTLILVEPERRREF